MSSVEFQWMKCEMNGRGPREYIWIEETKGKKRVPDIKYTEWYERIWAFVERMNEKPNMQVHRNGFELLIVCWEPPPISRIHRHRLCIKLDCSESAELYCFNTFAAETPTNRECVFNFIVGAFIPSFVSLACHGSMWFYQSEISVLVLLMFRYEQCFVEVLFFRCVLFWFWQTPTMSCWMNIWIIQCLNSSIRPKNTFFFHILCSDNTDINIFLDKIHTIEFIDWNFDFKSHMNFSHTKHSAYLWIHHNKQIE